ncbi:hypothetical protein CBER1_09776 [Cercospora berteroae]|uniref:C2H2-type domain-containing protein n=1 Tax=Cercospora berteroae TaxID=357750 RepID=A0A2S6BWI6_9PEZI|nr:hypothetical protein CBER1_09776 [Cercospora berteroae]
MTAKSRLHNTDDFLEASEGLEVFSNSRSAFPSMNNYVGGDYLLAPSNSDVAGYASRMYNADDDPEALEDLAVSADMLPVNAITLNVFGGGHSYIGDATGYAMTGALQAALSLENCSNRPFKCDLWPECPKRFSERKSLYRHMRNKHLHSEPAGILCPHRCGLSFARQDILKRHVKSQHDEQASRKTCGICGALVRLRSFPAHERSSRHQNAVRLAIMNHARERSTSPPTPKYPDAIADPVLLSAWALIKLKPWGSMSTRMLNFATAPQIPIKPSIEFLKVRDQVHSSLLHYLSCEPAVRDVALPDALVIMIVVDSITDGFVAGMYHARALVRLGFAQLTTSYTAQQWLESEPSVEAFETAATRGAPPGAREKIQQFPKMELKLLRRAAIEIMFMPFQYHKVSLWDRVDWLTHDDWQGNYGREVQPIVKLAESVDCELQLKRPRACGSLFFEISSALR